MDNHVDTVLSRNTGTRSMPLVLLLPLCLLSVTSSQLQASDTAAPTVRISAEQLRDKIRGGLLGQMLGNLNGLEHEFKYFKEPGNVATYTPALPEGARTDDDTDFEWVYIVEMQRRGTVRLSPAEIADLWRNRINRRIWCSNQYARQLMDLGLQPPLTGSVALNPWAEFNISGQFLCETFGLLAPAMPRTAARIGLNYTTVAIDGEPAQTTQLFTTMIATAFVEDDMNRILDAGLAAVDSRSELHEIAADLRKWHSEHPDDWRATRQQLRQKYTRHGGSMRDNNGYELNGGSTIAALLYGQGDLAETLRIAFNFGWDADNNAATAGTIVGVTKGYRWMLAQGWPIVDRYQNTTRDNMPNDETITSFADRLIDLAESVIEENGGKREVSGATPVYVIPVESPGCVVELPSPKEQLAELRKALAAEIEQGILHGRDAKTKARAAYLAICLDMAAGYQEKHKDRWQEALEALNQHENVVQAVYYHSSVPAGVPLRRRASAAGLKKPEGKKPLW